MDRYLILGVRGFLFLLLLFTNRTELAFSFGPVGHQTVAYIVQDRLSPSTLKKIQTIIGNDGDLASIANGADEIRPTQPKTAPWHYIDIPVRQDLTVQDIQKFCPNDDMDRIFKRHFL